MVVFNGFFNIDKTVPKYQEITITEVAEPTYEPVSLAEMKDYLKVDTTDDNTLISALIHTARKQVENELGGLAIVKRNFTQKQSGGLERLEILKSPLNSIASIVYYDSFASTGSTVTASDYRYVTNNVYHINNFFDYGRDADGYVITFNAGIVADTSTASITAPNSIRVAIMRIASYLYENRQDYAKNWNEGNWSINYDKTLRNDINLLLMPYHTGKGLF